jgi:predicted dehydrogenase
MAGTSVDSLKIVREKLDQINAILGTRTDIRGYPINGAADPFAYRAALTDVPKPACGIVVVPDHLHATIAADLIRAGLHVLVVKPLTSTLEEARSLVKLAEGHDVYGAVEFHKRLDESNLLLRQFVADGRLGDLCYITVEYSQRRQIKEAFRSWIKQTNVFQYLGVHYVDIIKFVTGAVTGAHPIRALATGQPRHTASQGLGSLDSIQAIIEWENTETSRPFVSTVATNWIDPNTSSAMSDQKITVVGTGGRYDADQKHRGVHLVTEEGGVEEINPYFSQLYTGASGQPEVHGYGPRCIQQFLQDVKDLIAGRCQRRGLLSTRPSFQEALVSTAVIEAVNRSLIQGSEWVSIEKM